MKVIISLLTIIIIGGNTNLNAQNHQWGSPDSVIAYLYAIRISKAPDSVKGFQIMTILQRFGMDTTSYRQFYRNFWNLPTRKQQAYLKKAVEIIRRMAQEERKKQRTVKTLPLRPLKKSTPFNPGGSE